MKFRHSTALDEGLTVSLNGEALAARPPVLLVGPKISPLVVRDELSTNGDQVEMELFAGFVQLKDEDADTDDPDEFSGGSLAG